MTLDAWVVLFFFIITYIAIFSERIPKTTASFVGALAVMIYGLSRGFITEENGLEYIKFDVIILLMSMMVIVNVLIESGFFGYVALRLAIISNGNAAHLLIMLAVSTAILSMIVDNVTSIILFIPITIEISLRLNLHPVPFLLAESMFSNIGGVATMVGDPPNIIIASYSDFSFNDFIIHLFPPVMIIILLGSFLFHYQFKQWASHCTLCEEDIRNLKPRDEITDFKTMRNTLLIIFGILIMFVLHDFIDVSPAFVALVGAGATLLVNLQEPEKVLKNVEWSVLLFFASLFVIIGAMDTLGILEEIANGILKIGGDNAFITVIAVLWITAIITAFVDNIPLTAAMAPVILHLSEIGDINIIPLWWALAMGVGFGGNATPIGSSAGIITIGISSKYGYNITMKEWMKSGIPTTIISLVIATIFIVIFWNFYT